ITGGPSVTKEGINAGNKQITNIASGGVTNGSTNAVTGGEVYTAIETAKSALEGNQWSLAVQNGETTENVTAKDKKVTLKAGTNISLENKDGVVTVNAADNVQVTKVETEQVLIKGEKGTDGADGQDGVTLTVKGKDGVDGKKGDAGV
ncbi:hypothetical protein, partial [Basilea psittacipulmonis]